MKKWIALADLSRCRFCFLLAPGLGIGGGQHGANTRRQATEVTSPQQSDRAPNLSVAVLPFSTSNSSGLDDAYFSTGITEDISSALGRFADLAVASPKVPRAFAVWARAPRTF